MEKITHIYNGNPIRLEKNITLNVVLETMFKEEVSHIPLFSHDRVSGILSEKDVLFKLGSARTWNVDIPSLHASSFANSPVISINPEASLEEAVKKMLDNEIGFLSVEDDEGRFLGILTKEDIVKHLRKRFVDIRVGEIMTSTVISLSLDERALRARDIIMKYKYSALPVIDNGNIVGIVDDISLLRHLANIYEKVEWRYREHKARLMTVSDAYKREYSSLNVNEPVSEAIEILSRGEKAILITENKALKGIVTKTDILLLYINQIKQSS